MECSVHVDDGEPHVTASRNVERGIDLMPHARWKVCGDKIQPPGHFVGLRCKWATLRALDTVQHVTDADRQLVQRHRLLNKLDIELDASLMHDRVR